VHGEIAGYVRPDGERGGEAHDDAGRAGDGERQRKEEAKGEDGMHHAVHEEGLRREPSGDDGKELIEAHRRRCEHQRVRSEEEAFLLVRLERY
jgi:hypothetical protein